MNRQWFRFWTFGAGARQDFYDQLQVLLGHMPLSKALEVIHNNETDDGESPNRGIAPGLAAWRYLMRNSRSDAPFSSALEGWVPSADVQIIEAGERSGDLRGALERVSRLTARRHYLSSVMRQYIFKPMLNIVLLLGMLVGLSQYMMPMLTNVMPRARWTGIPWFMGQVTDVMNNILPVILVLLPLLLFSLIWILPNMTGPLRRKLDDYPPFSWYRAVKGGEFMLTIAAMIGAGIPEMDSLLLLRRHAGPWLFERLRATELALRSGSADLGAAMYDARMNFPDGRLIRLLRTLGANASSKMPELAEEWLNTTGKTIEYSLQRFDMAVRLLLYTTSGLVIIGVFSITMSMMNGVGMH